MKMFERREVTVFTTPKELRDLADKMEREFPKKEFGGSCAIATWYGESLDILISVNQTAFHRHQNGNQSEWI